MDRFFNRKVDYFWECDYQFGNFFLKSIFGDKYLRKFSLTGNGIYNLILWNDNVYELSLKETKSMLENDGKIAPRDKGKNEIIKMITDTLDKKNIEYSVNSGKFISFKIKDKYIVKIEIVKKQKIPN